MEYSLWGEVQDSIKLVRGMRLVSTPGHGGIIVSKGFAEKNLSEAALKRGVVYGNYYSYEEDCDYAIPLFEIRKAWDNFFREDYPEEEREKSLLESLSRWNPDYLLDRGIEPLEKEYAIYKESKLDEKMRRERHPDLIICVFGDHKTQIPGVWEVHTADGKIYHAKPNDDYEAGRINLLSKMTEVKEI